MKKILFGITSLTLGGAERVLVDLANELSKKEEYEITIFTIYGNGELAKQISPKVKIETIYQKQYNELSKIQRKVIAPLQILLTKNKIYKKYIKNKYDKEIAFLEGPITRILACGKEKNNKIAWIHNDISKVFGTGIKATLKKYLDSRIYEKFNKLIFVSKNNLESFTKVYKNNIEKKVIYNYIDSERVLKKADEYKPEELKKVDEYKSEELKKTDKYKSEELKKADEYNPEELKNQRINLVTVARLVPQKAIDRLIKVHSKLINDGVKHNLYVIGEGPEKNKLEEMIKQEQCENTVKLLGAKENPYPYMKFADYICLFSEFEGYGMVLEEAKILNKKILITETAAKEAIENYSKGQVFENSEEGIYKGIKTVIQKENSKENDTQGTNLYNNKNIIKKIEELF